MDSKSTHKNSIQEDEIFPMEPTVQETKDYYWNILAEKIKKSKNEKITYDKNGDIDSIIVTYPEPNEEQEKRKTKAQTAFESLRQQAQNLFIDEYKIPHIALKIQDHLEVFPVNSNSFKNWYRMFVFETEGILLDNQTINDLCSLASAYASSSKYGTQINLNLRTASTNGIKKEWNYDLVNKDWEFIRITSDGWTMEKNEILFRRYNNNKAQVYPDRNYEPDIFDRFMKLVNIKHDDTDSRLLTKIYVISLFVPEIQKAVDILHGSQGSAKSSLQELIKNLVDPSIILTLTFPRDLNELIQQLSHNYIAYYDNISRIPSWISDQLCRAVSGAGSSKRQLYTDDDDIIRSFKRCIGINGINIAVTKADLLDRSILTKLEDIEDKDRRTPEDIKQEFESIRPKLLGFIFDTLVKVMKYEEDNPNLELNLTRMTEFSKYGEIIARCLRYKDNEFIEAYNRNRQIQNDEIIESNQIATLILYMIFKKYKDGFIGTPTELFREIVSIAQADNELNINTNDRYFPKAPHVLTRRLNEVKTTLKSKGIEIEYLSNQGDDHHRAIRIRNIASIASIPSTDEKGAQD